MNLFSISGLLIGILSAVLGLVTLFKGKKSIHYIWALFSFSVALWGFGSYKIGVAQNPDAAIFWWRIGYIGVILIPVFFTQFVINFLELKKKWIISLLYIFGIVFLFANFFDGIFINKASFLFGQFYYLTTPPFLYSVFVALFFVIVFYAHIKLFQDYKKNTGIKRAQIKYFLLATIPGFIAGAFEFLPVYKIELYPYLHFVIAFSPLTVTYAILRYRLMDLRIVFRKTVIYLVSAGFVYGIFFFLVWLFERYFGGVFTSTTYWAGLIIAPLFVVILLRFYSFIQKTANKYLFFDLYTHQETIGKLIDELTNSIDLGKIVDSIVNNIKEAMQLDRAGILLIDQNDGTIKYKVAKVIGFNENNGISLMQDNFLTRYLEKTQKPLVRDELQIIAKDLSNAHERQNFFQLSKNMKRIEASLCLPMVISSKLIGIIV
ncbi:MAG: histidine kinase N-terminal 7TM domain-containing protein, partial [bacterium]